MDRRTQRIRALTTAAVLARIDARTRRSLRRHAGADDETIARRLDALDREWDLDRVVETEGSAMALAGLALGLLAHRRWLGLPAFVAAMMLAHATTGAYPLLPLFRKLGVRTSGEIERERIALKVLRGDFAESDADPASDGARDGAAVAAGAR
ncbi:MAG TPA: hypothetical protein VFY20_11250 [Gemmatimonadales bacterium]|nr:hypothetical protein [Gemmatimonadales bacterium]